MEKTKLRLNNLIDLITASFPDERDLKGFLGISREMILHILRECELVLDTLKEHNDDFEMILLKRELAELFDKVQNELNEKYEKIKPHKFELILRWITKIRFSIRDTYFVFMTNVSVRTEADIEKAKEELNSLYADSEGLKQISPELHGLKKDLVSEISKYRLEVSTEKDTALLSFQEIQTTINTLKDTQVAALNEIHTETKLLQDSLALISEDLTTKQKTAETNNQTIVETLEESEKYKTTISGIEKDTIEWQKEILTTKTEILANETEYNLLAQKSKTLHLEIESMYEKVNGKKDETGSQTKGYVQEIESLKTQTSEYISEQKIKFSTQFKEIEALLPGATSVGLAEAYQIQKNSYKKPIRYWSSVFIITISSMSVFSLALIYLQFQNHSQPTLQEAIIAFLKDVPFFIPTIWLAAYASKQQSQYKRLEQEYAFKETNAKSFHGHKMQIEELMKEAKTDKDLLMQLVEQLVIITGQNPSATLDNKSHEDSHPLLKSAEKLLPTLRGKSDGNENSQKP